MKVDIIPPVERSGEIRTALLGVPFFLVEGDGVAHVTHDRGIAAQCIFNEVPMHAASAVRHELCFTGSIMEKPKVNSQERSDRSAPKKEHAPPVKKKKTQRAPAPDRGVAPGITG